MSIRPLSGVFIHNYVERFPIEQNIDKWKSVLEPCVFDDLKFYTVNNRDLFICDYRGCWYQRFDSFVQEFSNDFKSQFGVNISGILLDVKHGEYQSQIHYRLQSLINDINYTFYADFE